MARPIGETPTLYGEDAREFLREMKKPPSKKYIELQKKDRKCEKSLFC